MAEGNGSGPRNPVMVPMVTFEGARDIANKMQQMSLALTHAGVNAGAGTEVLEAQLCRAVSFLALLVSRLEDQIDARSGPDPTSNPDQP